MVLALVVVEDVDVVREGIQEVLGELVVGSLRRDLERGITGQGFSTGTLSFQTIRLKRQRGLERCRSVAFWQLRNLPRKRKSTYDATYRRLLVKLVAGRLVRYDRCTIDLLVEENSKVDLTTSSVDVKLGLPTSLRKANSRRPGTVPTIRSTAKLRGKTRCPYPISSWGIFGADYARSAHLSAAPRSRGDAKKEAGTGRAGAEPFRAGAGQDSSDLRLGHGACVLASEPIPTLVAASNQNLRSSRVRVALRTEPAGRWVNGVRKADGRARGYVDVPVCDRRVGKLVSRARCADVMRKSNVKRYKADELLFA